MTEEEAWLRKLTLGPPVAVGHISLTVSDVNQATRFFETVGMRLIHLGQTASVLELRGGTHLVVKPAEGPIAPGSKAPFDLMVDDIGAAHDDYTAKGMEPSVMESSRIHEWFTVRGPDGYEITIISSHASDQPV
jgi:catechol 2,3-dioxygenase-like lactoylglutathione lyase family enzyme